MSEYLDIRDKIIFTLAVILLILSVAISSFNYKNTVLYVSYRTEYANKSVINRYAIIKDAPKKITIEYIENLHIDIFDRIKDSVGETPTKVLITGFGKLE